MNMEALTDAHIHLDLYKSEIRERIVKELHSCGVSSVVSVSMHLESCRINQRLHQRFPGPDDGGNRRAVAV